jgi:hypothetical protein
MQTQYNSFSTFNHSKMADLEAAPVGGFAVDAKPAPVAAATPKQNPPGFKVSVIICSRIKCTFAMHSVTIFNTTLQAPFVAEHRCFLYLASDVLHCVAHFKCTRSTFSTV